jgi:hypothetical protein
MSCTIKVRHEYARLADELEAFELFGLRIDSVTRSCNETCAQKG